jgi:hypothetical protein
MDQKRKEALKAEMAQAKREAELLRGQTSYLANIRNDMTEKIELLQNQTLEADKRHNAALKELYNNSEVE